MRKMLLAFVAASAVAAAVATPAEASGGCGPYRHRAPFGRCYPNGYYGGGPRFVVAPRYGYGYGYGWRHRYYRHYW